MSKPQNKNVCLTQTFVSYENQSPLFAFSLENGSHFPAFVFCNLGLYYGPFSDLGLCYIILSNIDFFCLF